MRLYDLWYLVRMVASYAAAPDPREEVKALLDEFEAAGFRLEPRSRPHLETDGERPWQLIKDPTITETAHLDGGQVLGLRTPDGRFLEPTAWLASRPRAGGARPSPGP